MQNAQNQVVCHKEYRNCLSAKDNSSCRTQIRVKQTSMGAAITEGMIVAQRSVLVVTVALLENGKLLICACI